jgi:hypothetical protein
MNKIVSIAMEQSNIVVIITPHQGKAIPLGLLIEFNRCLAGLAFPNLREFTPFRAVLHFNNVGAKNFERYDSMFKFILNAYMVHIEYRYSFDFRNCVRKTESSVYMNVLSKKEDSSFRMKYDAFNKMLYCLTLSYKGVIYSIEDVNYVANLYNGTEMAQMPDGTMIENYCKRRYRLYSNCRKTCPDCKNYYGTLSEYENAMRDASNVIDLCMCCPNVLAADIKNLPQLELAMILYSAGIKKATLFRFLADSLDTDDASDAPSKFNFYATTFPEIKEDIDYILENMADETQEDIAAKLDEINVENFDFKVEDAMGDEFEIRLVFETLKYINELEALMKEIQRILNAKKVNAGTTCINDTSSAVAIQVKNRIFAFGALNQRECLNHKSSATSCLHIC